MARLWNLPKINILAAALRAGDSSCIRYNLYVHRAVAPNAIGVFERSEVEGDVERNQITLFIDE